MTRDVPMAPDPTPTGRETASHTRLSRQAGATQLRPREQRLMLLALAGPPVVWTVHFLGSYLVIGLWCGARWAGAGVAIAILTVVCALAVAGSGWLAVRMWRAGQDALVRDEEPGEPESWDGRMGERGARTVFLAVLALFMAALFGFLVVLEGVPAVLHSTCSATSYP